MCIKVLQRFDGCDCQISRNLICTDHVNHTHKQIDNNPCPKKQIRLIEMEEGGCHKDVKCKERKREVWVFEHFTPEQGDFTFLEDAAELRERQHLPKCLFKGQFTRNHACGVGKTVDGFWRHMDRGGFPVELVGSGTKIKVKGTVKVEDDGGEFDTEVKMEDEDIEVKEEEVVIKEEDVDMQG